MSPAPSSTLFSALPWLLVPQRSFALGKRRLACVLSAGERHELNQRLLDHVLQQAALWPGLDRTVMVSPCPEVLQHARAGGARVLRQSDLRHLDEASSETLNAALSQARREIGAWDAAGAQALMVVSSDLPRMQARDLQRLARCGRDAAGRLRVAVAADHAGQGTNALYLPPGAALPFCFGPDSLRRHCEAARDNGLAVARADIAGLAFDVDTPADLERWRQSERIFA